MARNFSYDSRINKIAGVIRNMSKGKLLIAGVIFGVLAIFAFIGVKSMMSDRQLVTQDTGYTPILPEGSGSAGSSSAIVGEGRTEPGAETLPSTTSPATEPNLATQDRPLSGNTANPSDVISLEGEPQESAGQVNAGNNPLPTDPNTTTVTATTAGTGTTPAATPLPPTTAPNAQTLPANTTPTELAQGPMGKLGLTILDNASPSGALNGEFLVYDTEGVQVASFAGSATTSFSLPPGKYLAKVKANGKEASRLLEVYADKLTNARFEMPSTAGAGTNTAGTNPTQAIVPSPPAATTTNGQMYISVRAAENNRALRSNIYVQKQNGQHVAKSNYAEGAEFSLEPGAYKVTVKVDGRQDVVRTIQVSANGIARETIMIPPAGQAAPAQQVQQPTQPIVQPTSPPPIAVQAEGLLRLRLNTGQGLPEQARFVIRNKQGERVATVGPAPQGEINLPAGTYEITAGIQGLRQSRIIEIGNGRVSELAFEAAEIIGQKPASAVLVPPQVQVVPAQVGIESPEQTPTQQNGGRLHLYAISGVDRQPLRVNFTVMTLQGQPLQSFKNVTSAELRVPPQPVQVRINYQTMSGTEVINVLPDQPTEYTFTISPNN